MFVLRGTAFGHNIQQSVATSQVVSGLALRRPSETVRETYASVSCRRHRTWRTCPVRLAIIGLRITGGRAIEPFERPVTSSWFWGPNRDLNSLTEQLAAIQARTWVHEPET